MFKQMASSFSKLPYKHIADQIRQPDIERFRRMNNRQRSGHGFMIDLEQTGQIAESDLQSIKCPTLILHSKHDSAVPIEHAYHAHEYIPHSKLSILENWGHLIWIGKGSEKMNDELAQFLIH
jgi:pimeloyl-ACP methyl ester carboxylesterase